MTAIAFIGLGIMGLPMAGHLQAAGYPLTVHTRSKAKAQPLLEKGAKWADTAADAAKDAEIVFICVSDTPDVEAVVHGKDGAPGILTAAKPGVIVVDHSTISPSATRDMAEALKAKGGSFLDAPVSGGDVGAKNATLAIMVGGEKDAFDKARPLLEKMGKTITHCGRSGNGQLVKLVNQILVAVTNLATCEGLTFARAAGLDEQQTITAVAGGAAGSWQLANLGPRMARGDFAPGFMVKLQTKDLRLVAEAAKEMGLSLAGLKLVHSYFDELVNQGGGNKGTQALFEIVGQKAK
jgi:3-hydroxyisobutyrate dehydrogenase